jgi:hypothetical protein
VCGLREWFNDFSTTTYPQLKVKDQEGEEKGRKGYYDRN